MKIFVLTDNYNNAECGMQNAECGMRNAECQNAGDMSWMLLPDSALMVPHLGQGGKDKPLYLPDFDQDIRLFPSVAIRVSRLGKSISPRFARRYFHEWAACLCAIGIETLQRLRQRGLPWGVACSFDGSFIIGPWQEINEGGIPRCTFSAEGEQMVWNPACLALSAEEVLAAVSANNIMKTGDIIALGVQKMELDKSGDLSSQGFKARIGMRVSAEANGVEVLNLRIK